MVGFQAREKSAQGYTLIEVVIVILIVVVLVASSLPQLKLDVERTSTLEMQGYIQTLKEQIHKIHEEWLEYGSKPIEYGFYHPDPDATFSERLTLVNGYPANTGSFSLLDSSDDCHRMMAIVLPEMKTDKLDISLVQSGVCRVSAKLPEHIGFRYQTEHGMVFVDGFTPRKYQSSPMESRLVYR